MELDDDLFLFEWDPAKENENILKHGVDFDEASDIFSDPDVYRYEDLRVDYGEKRMVAIGRSGRSLLHVVYTDRDFKRRLISAWKASKHDRSIYHLYRRR